MAGPYSTNILDIRRTLIHGASATVIATEYVFLT